MKTMEWRNGALIEGIQITEDIHLGKVVFLGEAGRGRRYEKVSLDKWSPAETVDGVVLEATPKKITLPARDGKPEKVFFVLSRTEKKESGILVRICTYTGYTKNSWGRISQVEGNPQRIISAWGAFGDAGRAGVWEDHLVVLHEGDTMRIYPSAGGPSYAIWVAEGKAQTAAFKDYENLKAIKDQKSPKVIAGELLAVTWREGSSFRGIKVSKGKGTLREKALFLGEEGRGREFTEVPLLEDMELVDEVLSSAGVVEISAEEPRLFGLVKGHNKAVGFLVSISTKCGYTRRGDGIIKEWKGSPTLLAKGHGADGDAGRIGTWEEGLYFLKEGDVLNIIPSGDGPDYALFVRDGKIHSEDWIEWKIKDGVINPIFYIERGWAPFSHIPQAWVGKVVTIKEMGTALMCGGVQIPTLCNTVKGEVVSTNPLILNKGWMECDYHEEVITGGIWAVVAAEIPKTLSGEKLELRRKLRAEADAQRIQAKDILKQPWFELADNKIREKIERLDIVDCFDTMSTEDLSCWVNSAGEALISAEKLKPKLTEALERQDAGEVLVNFGGHFRISGMTNQADYWVIRPDGSEREPDNIVYYKRYTTEGDKTWEQVEPGELAISWVKGNTAAQHRCVVDKLPIGGVTAEQAEKVKTIEAELDGRFKGLVGMSGTASPSIGSGWNLRRNI